MYNFAAAFVLCALLYVIGEWVSTATKAWIPSVFVTAVFILIGYWTFLPHDLITDSALIPFGSTTGIFLLITHMGTIISLKQLAENWKTIAICLIGLVGMCLFSMILCPMIMDRSFVISGLPPLTGGIVAATIMQKAAADKGLLEASVFAITMYCVQGFAGYPLTAVCLQMEGKNRLKEFRASKQSLKTGNANLDVDESGKLKTAETKKKKLIPPIPEKWDSVVFVFLKLGIAAWIATLLGTIKFPLIGKISGAVWALLLGIVLTTIGFLDEDSLNKAKSYGIFMFALMMYVFDGLKDCTPKMLVNMIGPMVGLIVIGVAGMAIFCFIFSKVMKTSFYLSFACALTALYGFPPNAIITENTCDALAETPEEKEFLMGKMFTPMIVGGFTTVTITSVVIAGTFAGML